MTQLAKVTGVATSIRSDEHGTHVRYHQTDVVSFNADTITLRSDGWDTATTKVRMNQASHQFGLGFGVAARKGRWYVWFRIADIELPFHDGMVIDRRNLQVA